MRINYYDIDFRHRARVCVCVRVRIRTRTHTHAQQASFDTKKSTYPKRMYLLGLCGLLSFLLACCARALETKKTTNPKDTFEIG